MGAKVVSLLVCLNAFGCSGLAGKSVALSSDYNTRAPNVPSDTPFLVVLGIAQDGSHPQAGCQRECCRPAFEDPSLRHHVASLGISDPQSRERWLLDITPDFPQQLAQFDRFAKSATGLSGVFLTHGHIGHYAGLVHLGREVMGAKAVPVYAMPRMQTFLSQNGPWDQLVRLSNIRIVPMADREAVSLNSRVSLIPFLVPHRDEYTETVGFSVRGPSRRAAYIPDIDKWEKWQTPIEDVIRESDVVLIDGTFFGEGELANRTMAEVPHPFIVETMNRLSALPAGERGKVRFIHLNHTNPALRRSGRAFGLIREAGFDVAREGDVISL